MVESELGDSEGWKVGKLGECGTFKNGINYLRDEIGDTEFLLLMLEILPITSFY